MSAKYTFLVLCLFATHAVFANYKQKHKARGEASYYGKKYEGKKTATGDVFSNKGYTAASNLFRLGAYVRVTNQNNEKVVYVKVNDRMGHAKRIIDLTQAAAEDLAFVREGTAQVAVKVVKDRKGKRKIRKQERND